MGVPIAGRKLNPLVLGRASFRSCTRFYSVRRRAGHSALATWHSTIAPVAKIVGTRQSLVAAPSGWYRQASCID